MVTPMWLAQSVALFGIWGVTMLAVAVYACPAVLADDPADCKRPWLVVASALGILVLLAGYGAWRLERTPATYVPGVKLRIVQPNLQQDE